MKPERQILSRISRWAGATAAGLGLAVLLSATSAVPAAQAANAQVTTSDVQPTLSINIPTVTFTDIEISDEEGYRRVDVPWLAEYMSGAYKYAVGIGAFLAAIIMLVGGFMYLTSADSGRTARAKTIITDALLGLAVILGSYLLLRVVNPSLLTFDALRFATVKPTLFESLEPKVDASVDDASGQNCSDPGFQVTSFDKFDASSAKNKELATSLSRLLSPQRVAFYKAAAAKAGIDWKLLPMIHYKEGWSGSVLNGSSLCNTHDDPKLLSWCPECSNPTRENDAICGAKLIARKQPGIGTSPSINDVKLAACKYNGCGRSWSACPEKSPYVAAFFDSAHASYKKSGIDCLPVSCKPGCVADVVAKSGGKTPNGGCCALRVYKKGQQPAGYSPGGSACNNIQLSKCLTKDEGNIATYTYTPGPRSANNPCGSWVAQGRPGALNVYTTILNMDKAGKFK